MSRLIDADALYEKLQKDSTYDLDFMDSELREIIERMPTAFDVEKVVAELEDELRVTKNVQTMECIRNGGYGTPLQAKYSGKIEMLLKAIGMVRKGGV